ncbi:hypothetical protein TNCV_2767111 [Trichonephila clavipes]|nr:hypothetical protein TNCV_2767111 [Trichonephila clavipes]
MRGIGDAPRNFEPHSNGWALRLDRFNVHQSLLHGRSLGAKGLEHVTLWPRVRDHNHFATKTTSHLWNHEWNTKIGEIRIAGVVYSMKHGQRLLYAVA